MPDRLVEQNPRPTWPQHHRHHPRRRRLRLQIHQCLANGFTPERQWPISGNQICQGVPPARSSVTLFSAAILLHENRHIETHEGSNVRRQLSITRGNQHDFVHGCNASRHLNNARIQSASLAINALEPRHFLLVRQRGNRIRREVKPMPCA